MNALPHISMQHSQTYFQLCYATRNIIALPYEVAFSIIADDMNYLRQ